MAHVDSLQRDGISITISIQEYEALTALESHVRRIAAKRSPIRRQHLSTLLERVRFARR